jgi:UTP--glucose-1-phosphate uridylyltransferase
MGSAIGCFNRAEGFVVPRGRFAPVKNCSDLLLRRSDAYILTEDYSLVLNPIRNGPEPSVELDAVYRNIQDFDRLFLVIPSLVAATSFRVEGEIEFDAPVFVKGGVSFVNRSGTLRKISEAKRMHFENEEFEFA